MTASELKAMSNAGVKSVDMSTLVDIRSVSIDHGKDVCTRLEQYINQLGNPYCFLVENAAVRISFSETGKSLDSALLQYFISLKQ